MTTRSKVRPRQSSAKDREFERLLRRAALYAKRHGTPAVAVAARRRRVKAA